MGKKSRRTRPSSGLSRRETIKARPNKQLEVKEVKDPREEMDKLKTKFLNLSADPSNKMDRDRIMAVYQYHDIATKTLEKDKHHAIHFLTDQDKEFIQSVGDDPTELAYIRGTMLEILSHQAFQNLEHDVGLQNKIQAIKIFKQATDEEKEVILVPAADRPGAKSKKNKKEDVTMEHVLDDLVRLSDIMLEEFRKEKRQENDKDGNISMKGPGGDKCSACGITCQEMEDKPIVLEHCCPICKNTYYCSKECQLEAWQDHKTVCRKPGEFKVGDIVALADPSPDCPIKFGAMFRIWLPGPKEDYANPKTWLIAEESPCGHALVVPAKLLRRIRSDLWDSVKNHQAAKLKECEAQEELVREAMMAGEFSEQETTDWIRARRHLELFATQEQLKNLVGAQVQAGMRLILETHEAATSLQEYKNKPEAVAELLSSPEIKDSHEFMLRGLLFVGRYFEVAHGVMQAYGMPELEREGGGGPETVLLEDFLKFKHSGKKATRKPKEETATKTKKKDSSTDLGDWKLDTDRSTEEEASPKTKKDVSDVEESSIEESGSSMYELD